MKPLKPPHNLKRGQKRNSCPAAHLIDNLTLYILLTGLVDVSYFLAMMRTLPSNLGNRSASFTPFKPLIRVWGVIVLREKIRLPVKERSSSVLLLPAGAIMKSHTGSPGKHMLIAVAIIISMA